MLNFHGYQVISSIMRLLKLTGTWPEDNASVKYQIVGFASLTLLISICVTTFVTIFSNFGDIEKNTIAMCVIVTAINALIKHVTLLFLSKSQVYRILGFLTMDVFAVRERKFKAIFEKKLLMANKLRLIFLGTTMTTSGLAILSAFFKFGRILPVIVPLDIEQQSMFVYVLLLVYESLVLVITCMVIGCFDGLLVTFTIIAAAYLEILREKIMSSTDSSSESLTNDNLKECVVYHVAIEEYIHALESAFTYEFLTRLLLSVLGCGFVIFNMMVAPIMSVQFAKSLLFFMSLAIQLVFCCGPGTEISDQNEKIRDACYMTEWTKFGPPVRKTLILLMTKSQVPFTLTAGGFVELSLQTIVLVARTAGRYFLFLYHIYENSEKP